MNKETYISWVVVGNGERNMNCMNTLNSSNISFFTSPFYLFSPVFPDAVTFFFNVLLPPSGTTYLECSLFL